MAAVEFAFIAPLMIGLTFGLIELGRMSMLKDNAVHATREGARTGIKPHASSSEVLAVVESELSNMGVSNASISTQFINDPSSAAELVQVTVQIPITGNSWIPNILPTSVSQIEGSTTMRRESTD